MSGTVLLIEGSAERRALLRRALEGRGFVVSAEAGSVPEVISAVAELEFSPETVLVGTGVQGTQVAKLIKRTWPKATVVREMEPSEAPIAVSGGLRTAAAF